MAMQGGAGDDPDRGRRIGKYEILTRLSMGGMAELFLAFTSGPGGFRKFVAVKQILPDIKKDEQFVQMFLDEARITAAFSHANIGQVFDLGEDGGELYLAMEFLPGQNLEQVVKAASRQGFPLPLGFVGRIIRDACLGLHYAHHFTDPSGRPAVVVHRDVSPKNVMITYDGVVKVIDFGIAKARGRLGRTQVGMVKGTSGYMSPEQVRGTTTLDGRSDLFSVGVMLHELLCGQRLFHGPHEAAVMLQIVEGEIPSPRSVNPAIPEALEAVVMRALSREVFQRFTSGREMARAIEAALGPELFDEDGITEVMGQLFEEKRQKTRTLLELASRAEDARVSEAADALQQDDAESSAPTAQVQAPRTRLTPASATDSAVPTRAGTPPRAAPPRRNPAEATATHVSPPSSGPQRRPAEQGSRTPRPPAEPAQAPRTPRPRPASRSEPAAPDATQPLEEPTELSTQRFRARPQRPARDEARTSVRPARPEPALRSDTPQDDFPAVRPPSRWKGRLFLLALVAGLGWLSTLPGVRAQFVPAYESARAWVKAELDPQPAADPATRAPWPPAPKAGPPPGFPGAAAAQAPAAAPQDSPSEDPAEAEEAEAPTEEAPPSKKTPGVRTASSTTPGRKGKEGAATPQPPASKQETAPSGTARRGRTQEEAPPAAEPVTPVTQDPEEPGEVVDTSTPRGAAKAGLGWLTLYTVPPAAVFDGTTQLGTTPMQKVLLPVGTYRLRVEDPTDAVPASRLLSAPIRPGEVTRLTIRLADLPLYKE